MPTLRHSALKKKQRCFSTIKALPAKRHGLKNTTSRADLESAAAALAVTEAQIQALDAQIEEAQVAVETAQANLDYTKITAPIAGTVLSIVSQEGQTVNATQSAPTIVILGQLDNMTVRTEISEADITRVQPDLPVYFTVLGEPNRRYEATLASIEPAPESVRSDSSFSSSSSSTSSSSSSSSTSSSEAIYYNGVFNVPNPDGKLRTYMTAEVHIVLEMPKRPDHPCCCSRCAAWRWRLFGSCPRRRWQSRRPQGRNRTEQQGYGRGSFRPCRT